MLHNLFLSAVLAVPQGFDFTIQSASSSVNLGGTTTTGVAGELLGDYDATSNPSGTQTRPGLFGGSGNMPVSCDFDVQVAISTTGVPDGAFHFDIDTAGLALDVSDLTLSPFGSSGTSVGLTLILEFQTFRTFNPDSLFVGGIPLPIPLGSVSLTDALFIQSGPSTLGVLIPDPVVADRYTFTVTVPADFSANVDLFGNLFPVGPVPFAYVLAGTMDIGPNSAIASVTANQNINQNIPNPNPGSFGPLPFQLPTILPPGGMASLLFTGTFSGIDIVLDVDVDVVADGTPSGCDTEVYCTAAPNSVGAGADISVTGSTSVAANDLVLQADPVPNQPAIFFFGPNQIELPFGNGYRCVGGAVKRLPVVFGGGNAIVHSMDNTQAPAAGSVIPGSTWNFQAWYRDPIAGGSNFNLSDAIRVDFCP
jgi:hypothetical protein